MDMTFFRLLMPLLGNTPRSGVLNTVQSGQYARLNHPMVAHGTAAGAAPYRTNERLAGVSAGASPMWRRNLRLKRKVQDKVPFR
ncbi:MAG: hypothetical protein JWQ73_4222 [Variovorax sp.]|nr:hypothetical protein [Variovorax sp.]